MTPRAGLTAFAKATAVKKSCATSATVAAQVSRPAVVVAQVFRPAVPPT